MTNLPNVLCIVKRNRVSGSLNNLEHDPKQKQILESNSVLLHCFFYSSGWLCTRMQEKESSELDCSFGFNVALWCRIVIYLHKIITVCSIVLTKICLKILFSITVCSCYYCICTNRTKDTNINRVGWPSLMDEFQIEIWKIEKYISTCIIYSIFCY